MLRALRQHLRQANVALLPHFGNQAMKRCASEGISPRLATMLRIEAARAARTLGRLDSADALLSNAMTLLPAQSVDLLASIKRTRTLVLLDQGQIVAARNLAEEVDCTEFERGKDAPPLFNRNEAEIASITWALLAEVALAEGRMSDARKSLEAAVARLARDEEAQSRRGYAARTLATPESKRQAQAAADMRDTLRFLEAVSISATGNPSGVDMLNVLAQRMLSDPQADRQIIARVQAAAGSWTDDAPPAGINIFEARRWKQIVSGQSVHSTLEASKPADNSVSLETIETLPAHLPQPQPGSSVSEDVVAVVNTLTTAFLDHLERMREPVVQPTNIADKFAYGGSFAHFDLVSMLCNAEQGKLTGFFHITWPPESVETTILANRLHPAARAGEGWIFLREGEIIDATVGQHDPAPELQGNREDAREMLVLLLQIGLGIGLDNPPDGMARGYPSQSVEFRAARLTIASPSRQLMDYIHQREKELHLVSSDEDVIGEWG